MDDKMLRKMLKLAVNPNATMSQLQAGLDYIVADIEADNKRRAAMPPQPPKPVLSDAERAANARRAANANLVKLRRR